MAGATPQESEGKIRVVVNHNWHKDVEASFQEDNPDHRIINCAYKLFQENRNRIVILVSKDTNMLKPTKTNDINNCTARPNQVDLTVIR